MASPRKLILYIAMSLDGYIAGPGEDLTFLEPMALEGEDYGYAELMTHVDTMVMGRKTYDKVLSFGIDWPHPDRKTFVLSRTRSGTEEHITYFNGDLAHLIADIRSEEGQDIYLDAGGEIVAQALERDLLDQIVLSIVPVLLGGGTRLFVDGRPSQVLKLEKCLHFPSGLTPLWYLRDRAQ